VLATNPTQSQARRAAPQVFAVLRVSKRFAGRGQKQANWRRELTFSTLTTLAIATNQRLNISAPL
jgi:hypothetical protein